MTAAISYQLRIDVSRPVRMRVGRLGHFRFPAGEYVYTGSAKRNLGARIARHLRKEKRLRWHIDWLLSAPGVKVATVKRSREAECILNQKVVGMVIVPGFGASDCRSGCGSHLRYLGNSRWADRARFESARWRMPKLGRKMPKMGWGGLLPYRHFSGKYDGPHYPRFAALLAVRFKA